MSNFLTNFSIHESEKSTIRVFDEKCIGCQTTNSDLMLSFGPDCTPTNGNNDPLVPEESCVLDVFINKEQALDLYSRLAKVLNKV